jgi:hypothetical protein
LEDAMKTCAIAVAAVLACLPAFAASIPEGTTEVRAEVAYEITDADSSERVPLQGGIGYYVRDNVQVGGLVSFVKKEFDSYWGQGTVWSLALFGEYNLPTSGDWLPFVGGQLGFLDDDSDRDAVFSAALSGGLKYFITGTAGLSAQFNVHWADEDIYDAEADQTGGDSVAVSATAGVRFLF